MINLGMTFDDRDGKAIGIGCSPSFPLLDQLGVVQRHTIDHARNQVLFECIRIVLLEDRLVGAV
jgi:hypothetical protein